jgi:hypothetical protein
MPIARSARLPKPVRTGPAAGCGQPRAQEEQDWINAPPVGRGI